MLSLMGFVKSESEKLCVVLNLNFIHHSKSMCRNVVRCYSVEKEESFD